MDQYYVLSIEGTKVNYGEHKLRWKNKLGIYMQILCIHTIYYTT